MKRKMLYRPTGLKELELIIESGWKRFPPRLQWQPIFYPVLHQNYAAQIAREWNTADTFSGYCGVVTGFELDEAYLAQYPVQNVGGQGHDELWIPSDELETFNKNILDGIHVIGVFFGEQFVMPEDERMAGVLNRFKQ